MPPTSRPVGTLQRDDDDDDKNCDDDHDDDDDDDDNKKLSYRKETVRLLLNIEIRVLH